jgi:hypothetical protein
LLASVATDVGQDRRLVAANGERLVVSNQMLFPLQLLNAWRLPGGEAPFKMEELLLRKINREKIMPDVFCWTLVVQAWALLVGPLTGCCRSCSV